MEHVTTVKHVSKMRASSYHRYVETLCEKFNKNASKPQKKGRLTAGRK